MDFLLLYTNFIRVILVVISVFQLFKRHYKKLAPATIMMLFTFVPWLISLLHFQINTLTIFLFLTVTFMATYLGSGFRFYDIYSWWDRIVHFLSGILFFSLGISLAKKEPDVSLISTLVFSFALSLALHQVWEILEFLGDSFFHMDSQHWQKHSKVVNHQPEEAIQPPGLVDTMVDTIAGIIGAILACIGWWIYLCF